jgi:hypothetical protein
LLREDDQRRVPVVAAGALEEGGPPVLDVAVNARGEVLDRTFFDRRAAGRALHGRERVEWPAVAAAARDVARQQRDDDQQDHADAAPADADRDPTHRRAAAVLGHASARESLPSHVGRLSPATET